MKIFHSFANDRRGLLSSIKSGNAPDTGLYGLNHLESQGIQSKYVYPLAFLPKFIAQFVGYHLRQILTYPHTRDCDVVFGSTLLSMVPIRRYLPSKSKFVLLNISTSRLLATQDGHRKNSVLEALAEMDAVVCLAQSQKDFLLRHTKFPKDRIYFVPLGVDNSFHSFCSGENRDGTILSVGKDNGRDYHTVVEVAKRLPERRFEIVCSRRNISHIKDIPSNVVVYFDLTPLELREKYRTASILLLVTHDDSFDDGSDCSGQTVLLDAMASGLPVIATYKSSLADYVVDGEDALVVPSYDIEACLEAIHKANRKDLRETLATSARRRVDEEFNTQVFAKKMARVFKEVTLLPLSHR